MLSPTLGLFGNRHASYHGDSSECNKILRTMGLRMMTLFNPSRTGWNWGDENSSVA
jgi:hypothetical protein